MSRLFHSHVNFVFLLLLGLLILTTTCSAAKDPVYTPITEATLTIGDAIPLPTEEVILTISGKVNTTNQDNTIIMDIPTIESLGLVDYTVHDPFKREDITYTGVLMNDLLDLWQIHEDATLLNMVALNDYHVNVPINLLRDYPVILALQADGIYMPRADRGPAMLVFPYDHFEFELPLTNAYWIWQIKSVEVE